MRNSRLLRAHGLPCQKLPKPSRRTCGRLLRDGFGNFWHGRRYPLRSGLKLSLTIERSSLGSASACQALPPCIIFLGGKGNLQLCLGEDENPVVKGIRSGKPVSTQLATSWQAIPLLPRYADRARTATKSRLVASESTRSTRRATISLSASPSGACN